jgi:hypothetical protein
LDHRRIFGPARLTVVCAVAAADQLLVLSLVREPSLDVVLDSSGVVERTRDNANDSVRDLEGLVKVLSVDKHFVEHGGRRFRVGDTELVAGNGRQQTMDGRTG